MPTNVKLTWTNVSPHADSIEITKDGAPLVTLGPDVTEYVAEISAESTFGVRCRNSAIDRYSEWAYTTIALPPSLTLYRDSDGPTFNAILDMPGTNTGGSYGDSFTSAGQPLIPLEPQAATNMAPPFTLTFALTLAGTMDQWGDVTLLHAPPTVAGGEEFRIVLSKDPVGFNVVFVAGTKELVAGFARPGLVSFGRPMHVAVVVTATTVALYLNGAKVAQSTLTVALSTLRRLRVSLERVSGNSFNATALVLDTVSGKLWGRDAAGNYLSQAELAGAFHVAFHPVLRRWFALGGNGDVWSADPGGAWVHATANDTQVTGIYEPAYDAAQDCWWLVGYRAGVSGVLMKASADFRTITVITVPYPYVYGVLARGTTIYICGGTPAYVARSTDGGASWSLVFSGGDAYCEKLTINAAGVMGTSDFTGLLTSADGTTWTRGGNLAASAWSVVGVQFFAGKWWVAIGTGSTTVWMRDDGAPTLTVVDTANSYGGYCALDVLGDRLVAGAPALGQSREWLADGTLFPVVDPVRCGRLAVGDAALPAYPAQVILVPASQRLAGPTLVLPPGSGSAALLMIDELGADMPYRVDLSIAGTASLGAAAVGITARRLRFVITALNKAPVGDPELDGWVFNEIEAWTGLGATGTNVALGRAVSFESPYIGQNTWWRGASTTDGVTAIDSAPMAYAGLTGVVGAAVTIDLAAERTIRSIKIFTHPSYGWPTVRVEADNGEGVWTTVGTVTINTADSAWTLDLAAPAHLDLVVRALDAQGDAAAEGLGLSSTALTSGALSAGVVTASPVAQTLTFYVQGNRPWRVEADRTNAGLSLQATALALPIVPATPIVVDTVLPEFTFSHGYLAHLAMTDNAVLNTCTAALGAPPVDMVARPSATLLALPTGAAYPIEGLNVSDGVSAGTVTAIARETSRWLLAAGLRLAATITDMRLWGVETFASPVVGVAFDATRCFALLQNGDIYTSADPARSGWSLAAAVPLLGGEVPTGLAAGRGMLVVCASRGAAATFLAGDLADLTAWHSTQKPDGMPAAIAFGAGRFVAVGNGVAWASPDGVTWTATLGLGDLTAITFANTVFAAIGSVRVLTSPDGLTWAEEPINSPDAECRTVGRANDGALVMGGVANRFRRGVQLGVLVISVDGGSMPATGIADCSVSNLVLTDTGYNSYTGYRGDGVQYTIYFDGTNTIFYCSDPYYYSYWSYTLAGDLRQQAGLHAAPSTQGTDNTPDTWMGWNGETPGSFTIDSVGSARWYPEPVPGAGTILALPDWRLPAAAGRWLNIRAHQLAGGTGPRMAWTLSTSRHSWLVAVTRNPGLALAACGDTPPSAEFALVAIDDYSFTLRVFLPAGQTDVTVKAGWITSSGPANQQAATTMWWDGEAEPAVPTTGVAVPNPPLFALECEVTTVVTQTVVGPWWTLAAAVQPAPVITSALSVPMTWGTPFSYQITAANAPTSFDAVGVEPADAILATAQVWLDAADYNAATSAWPNKGRLSTLAIGAYVNMGYAPPAPVAGRGVVFTGGKGLVGTMPGYPVTTTFAVYRANRLDINQSPFTLKTGSYAPTTHWAPSALLNYPAAGAITVIGGGGAQSSHHELRTQAGGHAGAGGRNVLMAYTYQGDAPTWGAVDGVTSDVSLMVYGGTTGQTNTAASLTLSLGFDLQGDNGGFDGELCALIVFDRALTLAECLIVQAKLKNQWGIA